MRLQHLLPVLAVATLCACGGGGGGGDAAVTVVPASVTITASPSSVAALVPGDGMTWSTATPSTVTLAVRRADGSAAAGAAVRLFTLSRTSPQDGAALEAPVPVAQLDAAVTDAAGRVSLARSWPAHLSELLVVATDGAESAQAAVALSVAGETVLTLAR